MLSSSWARSSNWGSAQTSSNSKGGKRSNWGSVDSVPTMLLPSWTGRIMRMSPVRRRGQKPNSQGEGSERQEWGRGWAKPGAPRAWRTGCRAHGAGHRAAGGSGAAQGGLHRAQADLRSDGAPWSPASSPSSAVGPRWRIGPRRQAGASSGQAGQEAFGGAGGARTGVVAGVGIGFSWLAATPRSRSGQHLGICWKRVIGAGRGPRRARTRVRRG